MRQRGRRDVRVTIAVQYEQGKPVIVCGLGALTVDGDPDEWAEIASRLIDAIEQARGGGGES